METNDRIQNCRQHQIIIDFVNYFSRLLNWRRLNISNKIF
jgi:hypothetical protein